MRPSSTQARVIAAPMPRECADSSTASDFSSAMSFQTMCSAPHPMTAPASSRTTKKSRRFSYVSPNVRGSICPCAAQLFTSRAMPSASRTVARTTRTSEDAVDSVEVPGEVIATG